MKNWKAFRYRLEYIGLNLGAKTIRCLPFKVLRPIGHVCGFVAYYLDRRGREVALANLEAAFGAEMTDARRRQVARKSLQTFARKMLDLFWSPNLQKQEISKFADLEGVDLDPCNRAIGTPVIYYCLHFSNFEWLSALGGQITGPVIIIAQELKNPLLGQLFDEARTAPGKEIIKQERAFIRMFKHVKAGGKFAMLSDLCLDPSETSVVINCFGLKTCVTQLHVALAMRTNARLVPIECFPLPDGRYRIDFHPPLDLPADASVAEISQI